MTAAIAYALAPLIGVLIAWPIARHNSKERK